MSAFDRLESDLLARVRDRGIPPETAPRRRPRRRVLGALGGAVTVGAVAAAAFLPSGGPAPTRLLTPQEAVAAASRSLDESDGVLEWVDVQGEGTIDGRRVGSRITRWIDLRTGDHSEQHQDSFPGPDGKLRDLHASVWHVGRSNWLDEGQISKRTGKRIVRRHIVDRPPVEDRFISTPVRQVKRDLERAARGDLPIRDAGRIDGIPVALILDERKAFTRRVWITKERSPRVLKSAYRTPLPCPNGGTPGTCRMRMNGKWVTHDTSESRTLVWKIHPRTAQTLAKIAPPEFDPAQVQVVTTHSK